MKIIFMCRGMQRVITVLLLALFLCPDLYAASTGTIKGTVRDAETNEALTGANILLADTKLGAASDINGDYKIENVPAGTYTVVVKYMGYKEIRKAITVESNATVNLDLEIFPSVVTLNEVVITGQGVATEKRKLTSSVETIRLEEIKNAPVESVDQLLQGRVTGLSSFSSSGMPGTAGRMSTRGIKSTVSKSTPVIYVDNVRVDNQDAFRLALDTGGGENSSLADLVVGEVDRIEVLKGGAASTLFGSEAANGVIQIFTKKGVPGDAKWNFNYTTGFDKPVEQFVSEDYVKNKVLQTGGYQAYTLGVSGGSKSFTYNLGGKASLSRGVLTADVAQAKTYNLNAGFRVVASDVSNLEVSSSYTRSQFGRPENNNSSVAPFGGFEDYSKSELWGFDELQRDSVLGLMLANKSEDFINRFRTSVNFDYTPVPGFVNTFTAGIDYRKSEERAFVPKSAGDFFGVANGYLHRADRDYLTLTMAYAGSYKVPAIFGFMEQTIAFGAQGFRVEDRESDASGESFAIPGTDDLDNASRIGAHESNRQLFSGGFYAVDQIALVDKIFLDFGIRIDGNSTFGKDIGLQAFPKAGIAYNISEEEFYPDILKTFANSLKLRASWGQTGNFPPPFTRDRTYVANAYLANSGLGFNNPGNDEIKPEKTTSVDLGFDMGLLDDRISVEFNYFDQRTKDALFLVPRDPASGFTFSQQTNVGQISNKGIEIGLAGQVFQSQDFSMNLRVSYATLENKVESLGGSAPFTLNGFSFIPARIEEGYPIGTFRINVPITDASGNYTGKYQTVLGGNPTPKQTGSVSLNMTIFNNLSISALTEFALGHQVVNVKKTLRYFNEAPDAVNVVPAGYNFTTASSVWLENADWVKIREIALTYRVPSYFMKGITLNASVRNVGAFGIKTTALDPEINSIQDNGRAAPGGYGYLDISAPTQFRFGLTYSL